MISTVHCTMDLDVPPFLKHRSFPPPGQSILAASACSWLLMFYHWLFGVFVSSLFILLLLFMQELFQKNIDIYHLMRMNES